MIMHGSGSKTPNTTIDFTDNRLTYLGRWLVGANGKYSGWASSAIEFKVRKTSQIKVTAYINRVTPSVVEAVGFHIDGAPHTTSGILFNNTTAAFSGFRTLSLPITNDGQWHTVRMYILSDPTNQFNQDTFIYFNNIVLDTGGELAAQPQGAKKIQTIGDSWMATSNDWPRLIDPSLYSIISMSGSGYTLATSNSRYNFDYNGSTNTTDESVDAILISFGANDYVSGVSIASFQTSLLSLIDKVQLKQPGKPIFLVRVLNNGASLYGQYLTAMNNAAGLRSNVIVIDTTSLDASVDWIDPAHLGCNGKLVYLAPLVKTQLLANGI